jgi:hypothetical protein
MIGVIIRDARAVMAALADPETLYVFGVIAARTSKLGLRRSDGVRSTPYVTPFGVMRETSLSRDVVEAAAARLKRTIDYHRRDRLNQGEAADGHHWEVRNLDSLR